MTSSLNHNLNWEHANEVTVTNAFGGRQSKVERDWTLMPFDALALVLQVLQTGKEKYGRDNWKDIPIFDHVQHMMEHAIASYQCSDDDSLYVEHLTHVVCRALFALQLLHEEIITNEVGKTNWNHADTDPDCYNPKLIPDLRTNSGGGNIEGPIGGEHI